MGGYANIDIIARRLQILIYRVYTIESELAWIGTERMEMLESCLTRRCSSNTSALCCWFSAKKKGCADGGNNRDYNCQRSEALCSRTLLFIRVAPWRRISFVKLKRTIRQRVLFPLAPGPMLGFIAPLIVFNVKRKCIEDLLIVEENY